MNGPCPFAINFNERCFEPRDTISYRVTDNIRGFPLAGTLVEVHDHHVVISADLNDPASRMRDTR